MQHSKLAWVMACIGAGFSSHGVEAAEEFIETVTVTASRAERNINEIASSVTVIDSQKIDRQVATDIRDLIRYEPGVVVEGSGRFGLAGFNIRGINGDRVLTLLDGAPIADEFSFGPALSARRDFIDIDMIDRVEIIRGPASTLYGSDAIGGVVSFVSKDPKHILQQGESFRGRVKAGYASVANEFALNAQLAAAAGDWQWLLNATVRDGDETETFYNDNLTGTDRNAANPQSNQTNSAQLKVIYETNDTHRVELLADYLHGESDTQVLSQVDTRVRGTLITDSQGFDERERSRFQVNYTYSNETPAFDKIIARAYWQETTNNQSTIEDRLGAISRQDSTPVAQNRTRYSAFEQVVTGVILQFDKAFSTGDIEHYLIYGSEIQFTDSEALRQGANFIAASGQQIPEFSVFPARDFPISTARELSFFVQDEISLFDGNLTLSPGIRYDEFKLTPYADDIFTISNPGVDVVSFDDSEVSLKLGAVYDVSDTTNVWAQFSQGFRIPPYDDLNVGFTNFAGGYTSLANPELEPESVDSWEVGLRQNYDAVTWSISAYLNDYENFIESLATVGFNPMTQLLEFQAQNRESVTIKGIDAQATWFMGESFDALTGWQIQGAITWLSSEDDATGEEIESILPPQAVLGVVYMNEAQGWSVELIGTFVERFDTQTQPDEITEQTPALFEAPGYAQFDLLANYEVNDDFSINAGVFNLFDREIWNGTEVRGLPVEANNRFFTSPGRNFAINATYSF